MSENIESFDGAIIIADALGTKGKWMQVDPLDLITEYIDLLNDVNDVMKAMNLNAADFNIQMEPYLATISDTIIACFKGHQNESLFYASL